MLLSVVETTALPFRLGRVVAGLRARTRTTPPESDANFTAKLQPRILVQESLRAVDSEHRWTPFCVCGRALVLMRRLVVVVVLTVYSILVAPSCQGGCAVQL